jgi:peptidoglycan/LPS O-acetylase OafA/YrhL
VREKRVRGFGESKVIPVSDAMVAPRSPERIGELDGLRAAAILMVVAWHYLGRPSGPDSLLWKATHFGSSGVDLFFVLSGYLITSILIANRTSSRFFSAFYGRRTFRILPIYYLMIAAYVVGRSTGFLPALFEGSIPAWVYFLGLQNISMTFGKTWGSEWLVVTWSLAIEEQFYLLWPVVVRFAPARWLPWILAAVLVTSPLARAMDFLAGDEWGYQFLLPFRADALAAGAMVAWYRRSGIQNAVVNRLLPIILSLSAFMFPVFLLLFSSPDTGRPMALWGYSYLAVAYGSLVFVVLQYQGSRNLSLLRTRAASFFARISYSLYLVHVVVLSLVFIAFRTPQDLNSLTGIVLTGLSLLIAIAICQLSYCILEKPMIDFAHRKFTFENEGSSTPGACAVTAGWPEIRATTRRGGDH